MESSPPVRSTKRSGSDPSTSGRRSIQGGTDVMVALNFDRMRPETVTNLNEVAELLGGRG